MKGFQQKTQGEGNFFTIKYGSIVRTSKTPQEGFEKIEGENPRTHEKYTSYIQRYDTIEALITKISWYDTEQRFTTRYRGFKLSLDAGNGKKGVLDLPIQSRATSRFMKLAENIDYTKPVEFRAWHDSRSDSTAFFVGQKTNETDEKSVSVPQKYTRENPGDMPEPTQSPSTGKWNYDNQTDFLHKKMMDVVIPRVAAAHPDAQRESDDEVQSQSGEPESNGSIPEAKAKVLNSIQKVLSAVAGSKEVNGATKFELMENYFDTSSWAQIEQMPEETLKSVLVKLDELVPF